MNKNRSRRVGMTLRWLSPMWNGNPECPARVMPC